MAWCTKMSEQNRSLLASNVRQKLTKTRNCSGPLARLRRGISPLGSLSGKQFGSRATWLCCGRHWVT
eukprot:1598475-Amphidinium_carterae.1